MGYGLQIHVSLFLHSVLSLLLVVDVTQGGTYHLLIGNQRWMQKNVVALPQMDLDSVVRKDEEEGRTVVHVAVDGRLVALITIADPIKPEAALTVAALKVMGIHVALLTGDNTRSATSIARKVGLIDDYLAPFHCLKNCL